MAFLAIVCNQQQVWHSFVLVHFWGLRRLDNSVINTCRARIAIFYIC